MHQHIGGKINQINLLLHSVCKETMLLGCKAIYKSENARNFIRISRSILSAFAFTKFQFVTDVPCTNNGDFFTATDFGRQQLGFPIMISATGSISQSTHLYF